MAVVKTVLVDPILVGLGGFTTHFRTYLSGWDVHWGYDLNFDPWPYAKRWVKVHSLDLEPLVEVSPTCTVPAGSALPP